MDAGIAICKVCGVDLVFDLTVEYDHSWSGNAWVGTLETTSITDNLKYLKRQHE